MSALRASAPQPVQAVAGEFSGAHAGADPTDVVYKLLRSAVKLGASDVHLRANSPPMIRLEGEMRPLSHPVLSESFVWAAAESLLVSGGVHPVKLQAMQTDFSCVVPEAGRFRAHAYRQSGTLAMVLRRIQDPIPDFASLRLPPVTKRIATTDRGLVLIAGPTGNGKSTTIAAMLDYLNQTASKHVLTIEDPVEFVFKDQLSTFSQREVGRDVASYEQGLEGALREDPDVLFIDEIRSVEALDIAINAAESGRLVFSTCHAHDASRAIARLINLYPADFRDSVRNRLADALVAIIAQRLIARRNARSRVLCTEVLMSTPTVRDCIRDATRFRGLNAAMESATHEYGCHTFDQMLLSMVRDGVISVEAGQAAATSPSDLMRNLKGSR